MFLFSSDIPKSGIAGYYGSSIFSFCGTSILLSTVAALLHIHIRSVQGFHFLHILTKICYLWSFPLFLIYLFLAGLGLYCCARAVSSCGEWGLVFVVVHRLLVAVASLVVEHRL